jgi:Spy/CpxP family protein refolding chaperone
MKKSLANFLLCLAALPARGQEAPPFPPGYFGQEQRVPMRELTPEQREQVREERRQRHEAWQQMSPEERHQLRRDIRDAGKALYPRGRHGRDTRRD